jgi:hypothetical protein
MVLPSPHDVWHLLHIQIGDDLAFSSCNVSSSGPPCFPNILPPSYSDFYGTLGYSWDIL